MKNWQELMDYVYGEIDFLPYYKDNKPNMHNLLALANEALNGLTVDYLSFTNSNTETNVGVIDFPNTCAEVFAIEIKGEKIRRCNPYEFEYIPEDILVYKTSDYKIVFNQKISLGVGELVIIGKGNFDEYTKGESDNRIFKLLPVRFHYLPAYWILQRLFIRAGQLDLGQTYKQLYQKMYDDYGWYLLDRRGEPATFMPTDYTKEEWLGIFNKSYNIYDKITFEVTTVPSLTPTEINNRINQAVGQLESNVYTKNEVDAKDSATLANAKDYTYSKQAISNKDNGILQQAKNYTDEVVGTVEDIVDELLED